MEIPKSITSQNVVTFATRQTSLSLQQGQILNATVTAKLGGQLIELLANNQKIQAYTDRSVAIGQSLKLQVAAVTNPVILKTVDNAALQESSSSALLQTARNDLLKTILPKNPGFEPLVQTLNTILNNPSVKSSLPTQVGQQLQNLLHILVAPRQITNKEGLKQTIRRSGIFLESHLANLNNQTNRQNAPNALIQNDLKANLLRLLAALKTNSTVDNSITHYQSPAKTLSNTAQSPTVQAHNLQSGLLNNSLSQNTLMPTATAQQPVHKNDSVSINQAIDLSNQIDKTNVLKVIEQAVGKILLQQNNAVAVDKTELPVWNISIPILDKQHIDQLDLIIHQEKKTDKHNEHKIWTAEIQLDMADLGHIYAKLSLFNDEINSSIWTEKENTLELVEQHLDNLLNQFTQAGLRVNSITTLSRKPEMHKKTLQSNTLIDLRL